MLYRLPPRVFLASVGADELTELLVFEALYDLPDGFHAAGEVGAAVYRMAGNPEIRPGDVSPYYRRPERPMSPQEIAAQMLRLGVPRRC